MAPPHTLTEVTSALERRRRAVGALWPADTIVLTGAGTAVPVPGRGDRTYPFHAHSEYFYLTDGERPGGVLAFDPGDGWFDFVTPVTRDDWKRHSVGYLFYLPLVPLRDQL